MSKTGLVIRREYLTRVRKKSFIILTLLTPVFMAAMFVIPVLIMSSKGQEMKKIAVVEQQGHFFKGKIHPTKYLKFDYLENVRLDSLKKHFDELGYYAILYISPKISYIPSAVQLISHKQPSPEVVTYISEVLKKEIERQKLLAYNIKDLDKILKSVETDVQLQTIVINASGEEKETSTGIAMALAYISGLLIYMLTFMFGAMVMRGVIEEKTNRIIEVLISSVKPFQLMMGKIIGIALVGLTQFVLWIALTLVLVTATTGVVMHNNKSNKTIKIPTNLFSDNAGQALPTNQANTKIIGQKELSQAERILNALKSVNWGLIIGAFILFFLGGYLLYASLFAAVGAAVDNETDTQQFMLPITIPLILALFIAMGTFQNPESQLAFWGSLIPFTSPVVMMARLPFGVPVWQLIVSVVLLFITFIGTTWVAAKIYRTGILMYGKKPTWKEMWKWIRFRNY
ncbi:MAG TPA: ABC transporter permease [Bacteroidetes bacterium]|nr:ABC transporter permease [Bacteroidota bacterium]